MKITKNVVPSIAYQVRTQDGVLVDEAPVNQPLEYLHGHIHTDEHGCCGGHGDEEGVCCNEHDKHHNHGSCGCNDHH